MEEASLRVKAKLWENGKGYGAIHTPGYGMREP
jgi:hypothetical protein